jgi:hypothetical protein
MATSKPPSSLHSPFIHTLPLLYRIWPALNGMASKEKPMEDEFF